MRRLDVLILAALCGGGCSFDESNQVAASDEPTVGTDARPGIDDAGADGSDADLGCQNFASHFDACSVNPTSGSIALNLPGTYLYNTDDATLTDPQGTLVGHQSMNVAALQGDIHVVVADAFLLGGESTLRAIGALPLAIGAFGDVRVAGVIDVGRGGAGARDDCQASNGGDGGNENGGGGGGGGGGYQGAGGVGGEGNGDGINQGSPGSAGVAASIPASPLGGCPGGDGGDGEDSGGRGGVGGGAIYLASATQIVIAGGIDAGGDGADGGDETGLGFADAGGGGGGSGGYVFLEAPSVTVSGVVAANGGGGGEGSGGASAGANGEAAALSTIPARGGAGSSGSGSDGGAGSASATLNGTDIVDSRNGGAGGGGGGAGFILIAPTQTVSGIFSPNPIL